MKTKQNKIFDNLLKLISNYKQIFIFHHINPDLDTLGSSFAMYYWLKNNFKNKKIVFVKQENINFRIKDFLISTKKDNSQNDNNALGIVFDTNIVDRIFEYKKYKDCLSELAFIDHHLLFDKKSIYTYYISTVSSSACEFFAEILFYFRDKYNLAINRKICKYLMYGIITDTGRFLHSNTTLKTFKIFYKLLSLNNDISDIYTNILTKSLKEKQFVAHIQSSMKTKKNVGYYILNNNLIKKYNLNFQFAKSVVNCMSYINNIDIWTLITEDVKNNNWSVSIRSRKYDINTIARKYNGGGHLYASGATIYNKKEISVFIDELSEIK